MNQPIFVVLAEVGIANRGGTLPPEHRGFLLDAIEAGLDVWSGLHQRLAADSELVQRASVRGVSLRDLRDAPADLPVGTGRARETGALRVLTVGLPSTDPVRFGAEPLADAVLDAQRSAMAALEAQSPS